MTILLYVPLNPTFPHMQPETWTSLQALHWAEPFEIVLGRDDDPGGEHRNVNLARKHSRAREMALIGGYDALLLVEADMIVPPDALTRLAALDTDVAYGLYCTRYGPHHPWLVYTTLSENVARRLGDDVEAARRAWGTTIESAGVGLGCTLIRRNVLESIQFRTHPRNIVADDWLFSLSCGHFGFRQMHDLRVVCGHIVDGRHAVWPDPRPDYLYRQERRYG